MHGVEKVEENLQKLVLVDTVSISLNGFVLIIIEKF